MYSIYTYICGFWSFPTFPLMMKTGPVFKTLVFFSTVMLLITWENFNATICCRKLKYYNKKRLTLPVIELALSETCPSEGTKIPQGSGDLHV
jgi:hypothetical protein